MVKLGLALQLGLGQGHQQLFKAVAGAFAFGLAQFEPVLHGFVKVFQQQLPGFEHGGVDFARQVQLQLLERGFDFLWVAAGLVNLGNAALKVHTAADGAQHFVAGPKHAFKQLKFLRQQFVHALVCRVGVVHKVDHHHVVLLPVTVAAAYALLNALGVPGQVVVDDQ